MLTALQHFGSRIMDSFTTFLDILDWVTDAAPTMRSPEDEREEEQRAAAQRVAEACAREHAAAPSLTKSPTRIAS